MSKVIKLNFLLDDYVKYVRPKIFNLLLDEFKKFNKNIHYLSVDEINTLVNKLCTPILTKLFNKMKNKFIRIKINKNMIRNYLYAKYILEPTRSNHKAIEFIIPKNKIHISISINNITINTDKKRKIKVKILTYHGHSDRRFYPITINVQNGDTFPTKFPNSIDYIFGFGTDKNSSNYINLPCIANSKHKWKKEYIIHNVNKKIISTSIKKPLIMKRYEHQNQVTCSSYSYAYNSEMISLFLLLHKILYHSIGYFKDDSNNNKKLFHQDKIIRNGTNIITKENYTMHSYSILYSSITKQMISIQSNDKLNKLVDEYQHYMTNRSTKIPSMYTINTILPLSNTLKYLFQNKFIFLCKETKNKFIKIIYVIKYLLDKYKIKYSEYVTRIILNKFGLI